MPRRLLLISTSTVYGTAYLEHALPQLRDFLGRASRVLFLPFAFKDHEAYAAKVRPTFEALGCAFDSLHRFHDARAAVEQAEAVFTGGGNTFRLLDALIQLDVIDVVRRRVLEEGMLYSGASAGANIAAPTIMTTNDMPIVEPPTLAALGLVSFQINPHYLDPQLGSTHMGETRETRIREFHEENWAPVVGLREGALLRVEGDDVRVEGIAGARVFRRGQEPVEVAPGASLRPLLG